MALKRASVVAAVALLGAAAAAACSSFSAGSSSADTALADAAIADDAPRSEASVSEDSGDADLDAGGPRYRIFFTREKVTGALGGVAGAGVVCTTAARSFDGGKVVALLAVRSMD